MDDKIKSAIYIIRHDGDCRLIECYSCMFGTNKNSTNKNKCSTRGNIGTKTYQAQKIEDARAYLTKHCDQAFEELL